MKEENILDYFNIDYEIASKDEILQLADNSLALKNRIKRKIFGRKKTYIHEKQYYKYMPEILLMDNVYLDGYWQSDKYFCDMKDEIVHTLKFREFMDIKNIQISSEMNCCTSVSIHIRRGDYIERYNNQFGNICTLDYYKKAMNYFNNKYTNVIFYVFSNDVDWVKQNMMSENIKIIDWNNGYKRQDDMQLMTMCKHNIIANSSFSWWGAWLNTNPQKEVIAPNCWINDNNNLDIWCEDWIKM
jgi:hypothetical protein